MQDETWSTGRTTLRPKHLKPALSRNSKVCATGRLGARKGGWVVGFGKSTYGEGGREGGSEGGREGEREEERGRERETERGRERASERLVLS